MTDPAWGTFHMPSIHAATRAGEVWLEARVLPGLEGLATAEIQRRFAAQIRLSSLPATQPGSVRFHFSGKLPALATLRLPIAVFLLRDYAVPRPRALLGHQHFEALVDQVSQVLQSAPPATFHSFRLSSETHVPRDDAAFARLSTGLAERTGLRPAPAKPDLNVLISRSAPDQPFRVAVRLTPYALADRPWRVCEVPGTLNATLAAAMVQLSRPHPLQVFVDLTCGSGTLLVERHLAGPPRRLIGGDLHVPALQCAERNLSAAQATTLLVLWHAGQLPLPTACAQALVANLPFGHQVGSHAQNAELYPQLLAEATRLAAPGAHLVLLSHEVRLLEQLGRLAAPRWRSISQQRIVAGNLQPLLLVLQRIA